MYYRSGTGVCYCIGEGIRFMFTHSPGGNTFEWRHGRHFESVTSNRKSDSVNRWVFTL